jgi:hypothetical protein
MGVWVVKGQSKSNPQRNAQENARFLFFGRQVRSRSLGTITTAVSHTSILLLLFSFSLCHPHTHTVNNNLLTTSTNDIIGIALHGANRVNTPPTLVLTLSTH